MKGVSFTMVLFIFSSFLKILVLFQKFVFAFSLGTVQTQLFYGTRNRFPVESNGVRRADPGEVQCKKHRAQSLVGRPGRGSGLCDAGGCLAV